MTTEAHSRMALGFAGYTVEPAMVDWVIRIPLRNSAPPIAPSQLTHHT